MLFWDVAPFVCVASRFYYIFVVVRLLLHRAGIARLLLSSCENTAEASRAPVCSPRAAAKRRSPGRCLFPRPPAPVLQRFPPAPCVIRRQRRQQWKRRCILGGQGISGPISSPEEEAADGLRTAEAGKDRQDSRQPGRFLAAIPTVFLAW